MHVFGFLVTNLNAVHAYALVCYVSFENNGIAFRFLKKKKKIVGTAFLFLFFGCVNKA